MPMQNDQNYPMVKIIEWDQHPDYIRLDTTKNDEWYIYQFRYLKIYLEKVINGWSIKDFFDDLSPEKIAVYADTIFTDILIGDLRRNTEKPLYISDKKIENEVEKSGVFYIPPTQLLEKYRKGEVCKIIVCGMFLENIIIDSLLDMGFELDDIVTLSTILLHD